MPLTKKLILGTVQLGIKYGINNQTGKPSKEAAFDILKTAQINDIKTLDTASGYGESESIIGEFHSDNVPFQVITKFSIGENFDIDRALQDTLGKLNVSHLECLMYHRFDDVKYENIKSLVIRLREAGSIKKIGVSIYNNVEFAYAIGQPWIDVIQIPFNLLDNQLHRGELLNQAKENGKEIHARSVFLQGLFFMASESLPVKLRPLAPFLNTVNKLTADCHCEVGALALQYVLKNSYIDRVLIGVEQKMQLLENIRLMSARIDDAVLKEIDSINVEETALLNPVNW